MRLRPFQDKWQQPYFFSFFCVMSFVLILASLKQNCQLTNYKYCWMFLFFLFVLFCFVIVTRTINTKRAKLIFILCFFFFNVFYFYFIFIIYLINCVWQKIKHKTRIWYNNLFVERNYNDFKWKFESLKILLLFMMFFFFYLIYLSQWYRY